MNRERLKRKNKAIIGGLKRNAGGIDEVEGGRFTTNDTLPRTRKRGTGPTPTGREACRHTPMPEETHWQ